MLIKILDPRGFLSEKVSFDPSTLLGLTDLDLDLKNSELCVLKEGSVLAKFAPSFLSVSYLPSSQKAVIGSLLTKTSIAEVEKFDQASLESFIELHNKKSRSRNPLTMEFMTRNRDSLMTVRHGQVANFRGLFNLVAVFTIVNYSRQMYLHIREQGLLLNSIAGLISTFVDSHVIIFMVLGAVYLFGIHFLHVSSFRRRISERKITAVIAVASVLYLFALQRAGVRMKIPVMMIAFVNVFAISGMLKIFSLSHVLYNTRLLLNKIEPVSGEKAKREILSQHVSDRVF